MFRDRFKKFSGEFIPDIIEYLKDSIEKDPMITITVGCDSIQTRRKTVYAITIMIYNGDIKNGAHVVFFRESKNKIIDNQERLYNEAQYVHDVGTFLDNELSKFYVRKDLNDLERKRYKFHLAKCNGEYGHVQNHNIDDVIKNLPLVASDDIEWKLVDLHLDFNPKEGDETKRGSRNKSFIAYKSFSPWLRGLGFRVWVKPESHAASSAADFLLKD